MKNQCDNKIRVGLLRVTGGPFDFLQFQFWAAIQFYYCSGRMFLLIENCSERCNILQQKTQHGLSTMNCKMILKGHFLERKFKLWNLIFTILMRWTYKLRNIDFVHKWINKLFSEGKNVPWTLFERWQRPPQINRVKQDESVLSFKVSIFIQFIQSWSFSSD